MAKVFAVCQPAAKVPRGTQLCNLGSRRWPYSLFTVCTEEGRTAKRRAQGRGQTAKVEIGRGQEKADGKDGPEGRRQRWYWQTAKPPLTPNGGNACRLPSQELCRLLQRKADGKELCRPLSGGRRQRRSYAVVG